MANEARNGGFGLLHSVGSERNQDSDITISRRKSRGNIWGTGQQKVSVVDKHKIGIKGTKNKKELKIRLLRRERLEVLREDPFHSIIFFLFFFN